MIISCNNCNKNFEVDSKVIPENGRLLQCNSCNFKWFFKKEIIKDDVLPVKNKAIAKEPSSLIQNLIKVETETTKTIELLDRVIEEAPIIEKISIQNNNEKKEITIEDKEPIIKKSTNKKSYNILSLTIVFIISFIAIIIFLDTLQRPISMFIPNIEFILYSLYETINDIILFFKDLLRFYD
jgi:predicted Zn finger-like uncharacterized protein